MTPATEARQRGNGATFKEVARQMSGEADSAACALTDAIHGSLTELEADLYPATLASCRSNVGLIFTMCNDGTRPTVAVPPPEALSYAKEYVRRGLGFEVLQRAYRIGQATLSQIWLDRLHAEARDADDLAATFGYVNDWLFTYVDAVEYRLTEFSMRERERHLRGAAAMRADVVKDILDGRSVDLMSTSAKLRYELDRKHVCFVIWTKDSRQDSDDGSVFDGMERLAAEIVTMLGANSQLIVPNGNQLLCWAGFRGPVELDELPRDLASARPRGLVAAMGEPRAGIEGFRRSYQEARQAQKVSCLDDLAAGTCRRFTDVALESLMIQDVDEARRFVASQLGDLGEDSDAARRLRATLLVFLEENGSNLHAARRLGVHENTIGYRVRRVEELLGRPVKDCPLDLQAALRLARLTD